MRDIGDRFIVVDGFTSKWDESTPSRSLIEAIIEQAIQDYIMLEREGIVKEGKQIKPMTNGISKKIKLKDYMFNYQVQSLCQFFNDGHLERLLDIGNFKSHWIKTIKDNLKIPYKDLNELRITIEPTIYL